VIVGLGVRLAGGGEPVPEAGHLGFERGAVTRVVHHEICLLETFFPAYLGPDAGLGIGAVHVTLGQQSLEGDFGWAVDHDHPVQLDRLPVRRVAEDRDHSRAFELARRYEIGIGNIMWGNDFPHPEGTWPHTREWLGKAFSDIPVDETQQILGSNAAECYHFDTKALQPLAERYGPTPDELGQRGDDLQKWEDLAAAGRPWLTGKEALELPVRE